MVTPGVRCDRISLMSVVRLFVLAVILTSVILLSGCTKTSNKQAENGTRQASSFSFENPKKSAHWESNTPAHGSILAGVPINAVLDFNFDLAKPSAISVVHEGKDYGSGETIIDDNKLAMRRFIDKNAPDGLYTVSYRACWPDGSCHDGYFQFAIDRRGAEGFSDLRGKSEVSVSLAQIAFSPQKMRISPGTRVIWTSDDDVTHYVNSDSHPAHTYFPDQNSEALEKGDSYSVVFKTAGIYPYHCSAHADSMSGLIIVE